MVVDVMMPNVSGLELLRKVRATATLADLPVLVLSAMDETKDRVLAIREGADDYLVKPADHDELAARVGRLMLRKRRAQIEGDLSSLSLPQVLQNLSDSQKTGMLVVMEEESESKIFFDQGAVVAAQAGKLRSWDAVYHLLGLEEGRFHFNESELPEPTNPLETAISLQTSLLDLAYFEDELARRQTLLPSLDQPLETKGALNEELAQSHSSLPLRQVHSAVSKLQATTLRQMISQGLAAPIRISLTVVILLEGEALGLAAAKVEEAQDESADSSSTTKNPSDPISNLFQSMSSGGSRSSIHLLILYQNGAWESLLKLLMEIPDPYLTASRDRLFPQLESLQRGTVRLRHRESEILLNLQPLDERRRGNQGQALINLASGILVFLTDRQFGAEIANLVERFDEAPVLTRGVVVVPGTTQQDLLTNAVASSDDKWALAQSPPTDLQELTDLLSGNSIGR